MIAAGRRPAARLDLRGLTAAEKALRKACRVAINRAARPVKARVVANAQAIKRRGLLAKSIRIKAKLYGTDNHVLVVGPSMRFSRAAGKTRGKRGAAGRDASGRHRKATGAVAPEKRRHVPWRYAGVISSPRAGRRFRPWLRDAHAATAGQYLRDVRREVARELARALGRGG